MKVLPEEFLLKWEGRIINLHPSVLPKYPGLKSIERAFEDKSELGVTLHHVIPEIDAGQPLLQSVLGRSDTLEQATLFTHISEQHLVRKALEIWKRGLASFRIAASWRGCHCRGCDLANGAMVSRRY